MFVIFCRFIFIYSYLVSGIKTEAHAYIEIKTIIIMNQYYIFDICNITKAYIIQTYWLPLHSNNTRLLN